MPFVFGTSLFIGAVCISWPFICDTFVVSWSSSLAGEMKPYKGIKYLTVDDRYADGWAYNPTTRRWIKVACQQKKAAIEAHPALVVRRF